MNGAQADADRLPERREGKKKKQIHRLDRESPGNNRGRSEKLQEIFFFLPPMSNIALTVTFACLKWEDAHNL